MKAKWFECIDPFRRKISGGNQKAKPSNCDRVCGCKQGVEEGEEYRKES